jgi:tetratricopeptide (TPR) repeat protein
MTPERQQAQATLMHAMEQFERGHVDTALEIAEQSLEFDSGYLDARRWLAERYEAADEPRKASRHLQVIIHHDHDDAEAWTALDRVDAHTAERLRRMAELPPDPFVAQRKKPVGDFADLEDMSEAADDDTLGAVYVEQSLLPGEVDGDVLADIEDVIPDDQDVTVHHHVDLSDIIADDDYAAAAATPADDASPEAPLPEPAPADGPQPWEHEQDRQYRDMMLQNTLLATIVDRISETWKDPNTWQTVMADCAHASKHTHADLYAAVDTARRVLGGPDPMVFIAPEGTPHCVPLRAPDSEIAINTGLMRTVQAAQLVFAVARVLAVHRAGHAPFFHTTLMVTDRSARLLGMCEEAIKEYLWDLVGGWFESHPKPDRERAAAFAHAWQLRAELSCDRAGLLACGNLEAACDTIAKMMRHTGAEAQHTDYRGLLEKHKDDDVGQLAAIPVTEDPRYNQGYAVYRIQMLRWWFSTDEYKALAAKCQVD